MKKLLLLANLSFKDLFYDKKVSFCTIASLIAVITPLLLLFSLKYGIISQLKHHLLSDPVNLEVKIIGHHDLKSDWFEWINSQPETQFVLPLTRALSTTVDIKKGTSATPADLIPTAQGDPLLKEQIPQRANGVILSALGAEKLKATIGDSVTLVATSNQAVGQKALSELVVEGILAEAVMPNRVAAFVSLSVLIQVEDYRDGFTVPLFPNIKGKERATERESFAKARIYAYSLDDVAPLAQKLRTTHHLDTQTRSHEISNMKAIDKVMNIIFIVIAVTSIIGCALSLTGAFLANIDRKRREIAVLQLLGFRQEAVTLFLIFQAIILSFLAFIFSYMLYALGSEFVNRILTFRLDSNIFVSQLDIVHIITALILTVSLAIIVATIGAIYAIRIQPAESLRNA